MQPGKNELSPQYLFNLDKDQLIDLLQDKTQLLVTASRLHFPDHAYIKELTRQVKEIQEVVKSLA